MSFYTSGVTTRYIQHVTNTNRFRTEFRLNQGEDVCYFTDLRLMNLGFSSTTGPKDINSLNGLFSCIKSISLMDENVSKNTQLKKNNLGFVTIGDEVANLGEQVEALLDGSQTTTDVTTTPKS